MLFIPRPIPIMATGHGGLAELNPTVGRRIDAILAEQSVQERWSSYKRVEVCKLHLGDYHCSDGTVHDLRRFACMIIIDVIQGLILLGMLMDAWCTFNIT